jgi:hypothetical protein
MPDYLEKLKGKTIADVWQVGGELSISFTDGSALDVQAWTRLEAGGVGKAELDIDFMDNGR